MDNKKINFIYNQRKESLKKDSEELQRKRQKFLEWLIVWNDLEYIGVFEMYPSNNQEGAIKSKSQIPQYLHEYKFCNTRKQLKTETRAEIDKLDFEKALNLLQDIINNLVKKDYHFAVFYAEGGRSSHIILYDLKDLQELKPHQREKARAQFWKKIIPFRVHLLDQTLWADDHPVPLEFSPHWKHKSPFLLIYEHLPSKEKNQTQNNNSKRRTKETKEEKCKDKQQGLM